jgi:hypothetical protein
MALLTARVADQPAETVWARAHRVMAFGPNAGDLRWLESHVRAPTKSVAFPHFFDAEDDSFPASSDRSERHDGQIALAFWIAAQADSDPKARERAALVVAGERSRHYYVETVRTILAATATTLPELAAGMLSQRIEIKGPRQTHMARQFLQTNDLSWFAAAVLLDYQARRRRFDVPWKDVHGCELSLEQVVDAQLKMLRLARVHRNQDWLPDGGLHTVQLLLGTADYVAHDLRFEYKAKEYRREANEVLRDALSQPQAAVASVESLMLSAHAVEVALCPRFAIGAWRSDSGRELARLQDVALDQLLDAVFTMESIAGDFALQAHLLHALRHRRDRNGAARGLALSQCGSI